MDDYFNLIKESMDEMFFNPDLLNDEEIEYLTWQDELAGIEEYQLLKLTF